MFKNIIQTGSVFGRLGWSGPRLLASMSNTSPSRIVWVDMEMTGLDIEKDHIMEVACLITDRNLGIIAEGPELVLHQSDTILNNMNEWCIKQHGQTGLTDACRNSKISLQEAEETLYNFVSRHILENCSPLAGNSVYMDRIIDVSTIKELCRMWNPDLFKKAPAKCFQHRALLDIKESVEELKYYRNNFFQLNS